MLKPTLILTVVVTMAAMTSPVLSNVPQSPGPIPVHNFGLAATFTANPSTYNGRCGVQFLVYYNGMITGTPGTQISYRFHPSGAGPWMPSVEATMTAFGIRLYDQHSFTPQAVQPNERIAENLEVYTKVPPNSWTLSITKVATTIVHCYTLRPPPR